MCIRSCFLQLIANEVHGYSMLRTTLNQDYFNSLFDLSLQMGVEIEGHRKCYPMWFWSDSSAFSYIPKTPKPGQASNLIPR